ncbi:CPBP family intramembrane glutamic endopeptidase [Pseudobacteriovorax antillogorgiicola]|uniref:CAAX protease self-immunity n=1 Tax=Pseudobacteriovorax antillogorgiicola TaxID=1513793 RepID=A0A1Y6CDZ4_9BACT|nr:CPBP family intramembrane glutamic endopeptidase [Pseudobacteriovorax antillogorgiicola]TCS51695.1 CAAX prenyl protease-like protein [Pseudobacteriovorax antillogorgiicola]SMF49153.1 CAAX protease self-immunity [Pseudobacteriovorax antillogorgiicola]
MHLLLAAVFLVSMAFEGSGRAEPSYFKADSAHDENRGDLWRPTVSFLLPGFDQYSAGHYGAGLGYTGLYLIGYEWAKRADDNIDKFEDSTLYRFASRDEQENFKTQRSVYQESTLANQIPFVAQGMSAYHAFRTSVESRRHSGQYKFLKRSLEETPLDIALAPFQFEFLTRKTTLAPLAVVAGLAILSVNNKPEGYESAPLNLSDGGFIMGLSFNAGTNEEAIFRGWLMPYAYEYTDSYFLANVIQSGLFSLAHINQTEVPIIQLGLGYYLGWLTKENQWTIAESIFIHTWWDVFAFAMQFSTRKKEAAAIWLPPLRLAF